MPDELDALFAGASTFDTVVADPSVNYDELIDGILSTVNTRSARMREAGYLRRLERTAKMLKGYQQGHVNLYQLREVMSTSDFPILYGDILDRRLLGQYQETPVSWPSYFQRGTVPDFRASRIIALDGMQGIYAPTYEKPELANVKYDNAITETGYTTQVKVYEKGYAVNWRMLINRSLNFVNRFPTFLARGARRTEEYLATQLFVDSTGPDSTFFAAGNSNLVTTAYGAASNNPPLSVTGLKSALNVMYSQRDASNPIEINGLTLVVPPLLQITAKEILKALTQELVPATSAEGVRLLTPNWASTIKLAVNWYLPIIDTSANKHTTWYLFADPDAGRPAGEITFLEGYEQPSLWQKAPNTQRLGGSIDPLMGDFQDMSLHYKGIHILGGTLLDPKMAVVSNGSAT